MTVAQLIDELHKQPPTAKVYFDNQEFGPDELTGVALVERHSYWQSGEPQRIDNAVWLEFDSW